MKNLIYGFVALVLVSSFSSCGKSTQQKTLGKQDSLKREALVKDSLLKDSICKDSIRWCKTTTDMTFHALKGPIKKCTYKVSGAYVHENYTLKFDETGNLTSSFVVSPLGDKWTSPKRNSKGLFNRMNESGMGTAPLLCDKQGRLKQKGTSGGPMMVQYNKYSYKGNNAYPSSVDIEYETASGCGMGKIKYIKFDDHGNWTKCKVSIVWGGALPTKETRTITRDIVSY